MKRKSDKLFLILLCFICALIPFVNTFSIKLGKIIKIIPDLTIIIMMILLFIYSYFFRAKITIIKTDILVITFVLFTSLSSYFLNAIPILIIIQGIRSFFIMYILYFVLRNMIISRNSVAILMKLNYSVLVIVSLLAIIEVATSKRFGFPSEFLNSIVYQDNFSRAYGVLLNPNTLASYIIFVLCFLFFCKKIYNISFPIFLIIIPLTALILTKSRSGIIALISLTIVNLFIFYYDNRNSFNKSIKSLFNRHSLKILIVFLLVLFLTNITFISSNNNQSTIKDNKAETQTTENIYDTQITNEQSSEVELNNDSFSNRLFQIFDSEFWDLSSKSGRIFYFKRGLDIWTSSVHNLILGTGIGSYGSSTSSLWNPPMYEKFNIQSNFYADNQYISIIVEHGLIGIMFFVLFIILLISNLQSKLSIVIVFLLLWFALFYNILEMQSISFCIYLCLGITENKTYIDGKNRTGL